jgi:drug/metabolite transporter (DMT)-like permease
LSPLALWERGGGEGILLILADMTWTAFSFLFTGVALNALAQLLLKAGTNVLGVITLTRDNWTGEFGRMAVEPHFIGGVACYGISLIVWIIGLSRVPVSIAYPMLSLGYVINAIAAHYLLGESVSIVRWLGIGFIVLGVWLVARG